MKQPRKLLRSPSPFKNESLPGYIIRLTEENFYESTTYIYGLLDIQNDRSLQKLDSEALLELSGITDVIPERLKELSFLTSNKEVVSEQFLHIKKGKVCPKCLKEKGYLNKLWDLVFFTECPIHKILLADQCPNCKKDISLGRNNISKCKCQYDLTQINTKQTESKNLTLSQNIWCKYNQMQHKNGNTLNPLLNESKLNETFELIFLIIRMRNWGKGKKTPPIKSMKISELHEIISNIMEVYGNWPVNFYKFLDAFGKEYMDNNSLYSGKGIYGQFGELYRILKESERYTEFPFLINAFEEYILFNIDNFISSPALIVKIAEKAGVSEQIMFGNEAGKYLSLKRKTIQSLIKMGILKGVLNKTDKNIHTLVWKESATELKGKMLSWISFREGMKYLNISEGVLLQMIENRMFEVLEIPLNNGKSKRRIINPRSIDHLFRRIENSLLNNRNNENEDKLISFNKAFELSRNIMVLKNFTLVSFLKMVLDKEILPCNVGKGVGFKKYLFNKEEVITCFQKKINDQEFLSRDEVIKILNISRTVFGHLVRIGMIKIEERKNEFQRVKVDSQEIKRFNETYLKIKQIKESYNFNFNPSVNNLMKVGIFPKTGTLIDGGRTYFFLKSDIENYIVNNKQ